jgi:hypothetical protein
VATTHPNSKLIPKVIVDVNNNIKTVWVKPEHADEETLRNLAPTLENANLNEDGLRRDTIGQNQGSLLHTKEERARSAERKYGSDALSEAAAIKFEAAFGVSIEDAPPVELDDERLYDYVAQGLSAEQAYEFKRFGIDPEDTHPKLDAEYTFVSQPRVAAMDLKNQRSSDSGLRKAEMANIKATARLLQQAGIPAENAAFAIANGLRKEHVKNDKNHSVEEVVDAACAWNVESEDFKKFTVERPEGEGGKAHPESWISRQSKKAGVRIRRAMWRSVRRRGRRLYNNVARRISRFFKLAFLPWKTR